MNAGWEHARHLLGGPLPTGAVWPLTLSAVLCDLRPRFLPKGTAGRGFRAVARNGRVLLCGDLPPGELAGRPALVRLQTWHKVLLPGDAPSPYGILLVVRTQERLPAGPSWTCRLLRTGEAEADLLVDVGGGMTLTFSYTRRGPL